MHSSKIRTIYRNSGTLIDEDGFKIVGLPCELTQLDNIYSFTLCKNY